METVSVYVHPEVSVKFYGEVEFSVQKNFTLLDKRANLQITSLDLKVTSHRIQLFNPEHKTANFEILFSQVGLISTESKGLFSKQVSKVIIAMKDNSMIEIFKQKHDHKELLELIQKTYHSREWEKKSMIVRNNDIQAGGFQGMVAKEQQKMQETSMKVQSSFGDLDDLMKSVNELKEVISFMKQQGNSNNAKNDEVEEILKNMGCFSIITKDEAGEKFFEQVARQVSEMMKPVLVQRGGLMTLIDVFFYYNRLRGTHLISGSDLLQSSQYFDKLHLDVLFTNMNGLKMLQLRSFNSQSDYESNIKPLVEANGWVSPEGLAKTQNTSLAIARHKLNTAYTQGLLCLDDSLEGLRFYANDIIDYK